MAGVLITGFEPFDGETVNPSWEVVQQLDGTMIAGQTVIARQLPCVFGEALSVLYTAINALQPKLVIAVGQAGGRVDISLERVAINVDDARIPDNQGQQPVDTPIVAGGPAAWFSTLPIKAIVSALRDRGIPASVSQTAGTFVCNHVFFGLMHTLATRRELKHTRGGFIHVPWLPEQGTPGMALDNIVRGLRLAVRCALQVEHDTALGAGTTN